MKTLTELAKEAEMDVSILTIDDVLRHGAYKGAKEVSMTKEQMDIFTLFKERHGFVGDVFGGVRVISEDAL